MVDMFSDTKCACGERDCPGHANLREHLYAAGFFRSDDQRIRATESKSLGAGISNHHPVQSKEGVWRMPRRGQ